MSVIDEREKYELKGIRLINANLLLTVMDFTYKCYLKSSIPFFEKDVITKAYEGFRECVVKSPTFDRNWHTGEPIEEGWYLVKSKQTLPYHIVYWKDNRWLSTDDSIYRKDIVLKWKKIED